MALISLTAALTRAVISVTFAEFFTWASWRMPVRLPLMPFEHRQRRGSGAGGLHQSGKGAEIRLGLAEDALDFRGRFGIAREGETGFDGGHQGAGDGQNLLFVRGLRDEAEEVLDVVNG